MTGEKDHTSYTLEGGLTGGDTELGRYSKEVHCEYKEVVLTSVHNTSETRGWVVVH